MEDVGCDHLRDVVVEEVDEDLEMGTGERTRERGIEVMQLEILPGEVPPGLLLDELSYNSHHCRTQAPNTAFTSFSENTRLRTDGCPSPHSESTDEPEVHLESEWQPVPRNGPSRLDSMGSSFGN
jgi:hypothetical protein